MRLKTHLSPGHGTLRTQRGTPPNLRLASVPVADATARVSKPYQNASCSGTRPTRVLLLVLLSPSACVSGLRFSKAVSPARSSHMHMSLSQGLLHPDALPRYSHPSAQRAAATLSLVPETAPRRRAYRSSQPQQRASVACTASVSTSPTKSRRMPPRGPSPPTAPHHGSWPVPVLERLKRARRIARAGNLTYAAACACDALRALDCANPLDAAPQDTDRSGKRFGCTKGSGSDVGSGDDGDSGGDKDGDKDGDSGAGAPTPPCSRLSASQQLPLVLECNHLFRVLGDAGQLSAAQTLFKCMLAAGLEPTQVTYGTLIARAGQWRQPRLAVAFYREMQRRGVEPDAQTYNSLINAFAKSADVNKAFALAAAMRARGVQPTLVTFNTLLDACAHARNHTLAHATLRRLAAAGFQPSERTFSIMIHLCARLVKVEEAFEWLHKLESAKLKPNAVIYSALINACGRAGQLERGFAILAEMERRRLSPNVVTFTTLIDACAKGGQLRRATALFRRMLACGVAPNAITCHALFHGCLAQGDVLSAREVLAYMKSIGLKPSAHAFTTLLVAASSEESSFSMQQSAAIACLVRQLALETDGISQSKMANAWQGKMISRSVDGGTQMASHEVEYTEYTADAATAATTANAIANTTAADGGTIAGTRAGTPSHLGLGGSLAPAASPTAPFASAPAASQAPSQQRRQERRQGLAVLDTLLAARLQPPADAWQGALHAAGSASAARQVLRRLGLAAAAADATTLEAALEACVRTSQPQHATPLLEQLLTRALPLRQSLCEQLISACAEARDAEAAMKLYALVQQQQMHISAISYAELLKAVGPRSQATLAQMATQQNETDTLAILNAQTTGDLDDTQSAQRPTSSPPTSPSPSLSASAPPDAPVVQPFLSSSTTPAPPELLRVFKIFGEMRASGVVPDRAAFNALINACAKVGDVPRAEGAFTEMAAAGIEPDVISYTCLLKACAVAGDVAQAERIWLEMGQRTNHFTTYTPPSTHCYAHLMTANRKASNITRVLELLDEMQARGLSPTAAHFSTALQACEAFSHVPRALTLGLALYDKMVSRAVRLDNKGMLALTRLCEAQGEHQTARRIRQERSMHGTREKPTQSQPISVGDI